ncbi:uncharacterized protein LOC134197404 [Corticium candelabrum]|uniref:uncharacterized protein LOC134197404 n=1 Tax=Corticium candelabrum TaxID=121492 RepID=UPI002E277540|nr:uncharacterized protein LOC134197404 [Corticium candelabrum]
MAGTAGKYEKLHDSSRDEDGSRPTAGRRHLLPLNLDTPRLPRACQVHLVVTVLMGVATAGMVIVTFWPHNSTTVETVGQNTTTYLVDVEAMMNEMKGGLSSNLTDSFVQLTDNLTVHVDIFAEKFFTAVTNITDQVTNQRDKLLAVATALNETLETLSTLQTRLKSKTEQLMMMIPKNMTDLQRALHDSVQAQSQLLSTVAVVTNETHNEIISAQTATGKTLDLLTNLRTKIPESISDDVFALEEGQDDLFGVLGGASDGMKEVIVMTDDNARAIANISLTTHENLLPDLDTLSYGQVDLEEGQDKIERLQDYLSTNLSHTISDIKQQLFGCGMGHDPNVSASLDFMNDSP